MPVGKNNCFSDFESPLSDSFDYFYVGVTYNGNNYSYYVTVFDSSGVGVRFIRYGDLANGSFEEKIVDGVEAPGFKNIYLNAKENTTYSNYPEYTLPVSNVEGLEKFLYISNSRDIEIISKCEN